MADDSSAGSLFHQGRLADAIAAATTLLRREPGSLPARTLLAELLLFAGNLERADAQMSAALALDPALAIAAAEFRQLLRAEQARTQLLAAGRVPEFLPEGPTEAQRAALAAVVALRDGDPAAARRHSDAAEAARPPVAFTLGDRQVEDFRDADDLIGGSLEVLTPTGKYLWIPFERIASLLPHPPQRPRDLYWRRVTLVVADGPDGDVYVPVLYVAEPLPADEALLLGRATDWREPAEGFVRGVGQRMFLGGEDGLAVMELPPMARRG